MQDYGAPPLRGLDGEIYRPGTVDDHAAMTGLPLRGSNAGGDPEQFFPPLPANEMAAGFLTGGTALTIVSQAKGYPGMPGAMFWTIDAGRRGTARSRIRLGPNSTATRQRSSQAPGGRRDAADAPGGFARS